MKTLDKWEMQERNKVQRVLTEESILSVIDHPFLATCYCTIQTDSHLHFVMEFCEGGELYGLLNAQPRKRLKVRPAAARVQRPCLSPVAAAATFHTGLKDQQCCLNSAAFVATLDRLCAEACLHSALLSLGCLG